MFCIAAMYDDIIELPDILNPVDFMSDSDMLMDTWNNIVDIRMLKYSNFEIFENELYIQI